MECWLCGRNGARDPLDRHHIFGGSRRDKSDRMGLVVFLCHRRCHLEGKQAVHRNPATMRRLHQYGQREAMAAMGWTVEDFIREFGKNYLDAEETEAMEHDQSGNFTRKTHP